MKIKLKIFLLLIPILIFLNNTTYSAVDVSGRFFALQNKNEKRKTGYYYIATENSLKPVTKIVESNDSGTVQKNNKEIGVYSINNGAGISSNKYRKNVEKYSQYFGLEEYKNINSTYKIGLPKNEIAYNQLAWVLDNICTSENELSRQALLISAGINTDIFKSYQIENFEKEDIERDIIESVQQAAIWYFTNPTGEYHPTDNIQLFVSQDLKSVTNLSEIKTENGESPIIKLYRYLIDGAINAVQNGYNYSNEVNKAPIVFDKSNASVDSIGNEYVIGPYNISLAQSNCTLDVSITNGIDEIRDVKILGEDLQQELVGDSISNKIISNLGKNFFIAVPNTTSATKININVKTNYNDKKITYWSTNANNVRVTEPLVLVKNEAKTNEDSDSKQIQKTNFDLSLRQFITTINDNSPDKSREPEYKRTDLKELAEGTSAVDNGTTLVKKQKKEGISVDTGDRILLTIRVYNEGQIDGRANVVAEFLPDGLEFIEDSELNSEYRWFKYNGNDKILLTDYLNETDIKAFNNSIVGDNYKIDYKDIQLECRVKATTKSTDISMKAIAEITSSSNVENIPDRDSNANNITIAQINDYNPGTSSEGKGYEDDDDYEEMLVDGKYFDLALKSYISEVEDPSGNRRQIKREPKVDVAPIVGGGNTANYFGAKGPVSIEAGDIVTYTIRVYNEGQVDGYAEEIMYHMPEELEYVNDEFNAGYGWIIDTTDETQRTLTTKALSKERDEDNIIPAFNNTLERIEYKEIKLKCKSKMTAPELKEITSVVEITKTNNNSGLADRDNKSNVTLPSDKDLEKYKGDENNKSELTDHNNYYKGQEDDDDFDKIVLEKFDLALRYFITAVNGKTIPETREPVVDTSTYGESTGNNVNTTFKYTHSKEAIKVCNNDEITFTVRVYNEGTQDGYAAQIGNNIPSGMKFVPENEVNQKYQWKMYDEKGRETQDVDNAIYVKSNYLEKNDSEEQDNLIKAFNSDGDINYKDVKVVLKISKANSREDRLVSPQAQIIQETDTDGGKVNDVDSSPNSWQDGEDDQDEEKIYVKFFDLSIKMIVDKVMTIEEGYENESETTQKLTDEGEEPVVNVSINDENIENTIIKFRYKIQITNEGEIPGTAAVISSYLPEGMRFNQADNLRWKEDNGIVSTQELKSYDIEVGESKNVFLTLVWANEEANSGVKKNYVEITEIKNNSGSEDVDSLPGNKDDSEDDMTSSLISITSMKGKTNRFVILIIIVTIAIIVSVGMIMIKKFVF